MEAGIATVFQDLAKIPLMSVARNFFMGREPVKGWVPFRRFDVDHANRVTLSEMKKTGINLRGADQAVGTLSGGGTSNRGHRPRCPFRGQSDDPG